MCMTYEEDGEKRSDSDSEYELGELELYKIYKKSFKSCCGSLFL